MDNCQGGDQAGQFAGAQEMPVRGRAPSRLALRLEKGLHHEHAAGCDQPENSPHAGSVKIIEYQNRIKSTQLGPGALEIQFPPVDGKTIRRRESRSDRELGRIPIERDDAGAPVRRSQSVPAAAAS